MSVHTTAIISRGAQLGQDVDVGAFSVIGPNVVLGDGCKIHHHVTIEGHTTLGDNCEVFPQAVLGTPPQDIKFQGEKTTLEIGEGNVFREMVSVHPGTGNGGGVTRIGDNNLVLIGVHIAHDCVIGNNCIFANYVQFAGHVHVQDHVNMGGHCAVHHFVTIGHHAFVGGMTRVSADVPPYMVVVAARGTRTEVRMVNGVGLQRSGFHYDDIAALKGTFLKIFSRRARLSGTGIRERVEEILNGESNNSHVRYLCEFLLRSFAHGRHGRYLESLRADAIHRDSWKLSTPHRLTIDIVGSGSVNQLKARDTTIQGMQLVADPESGWTFAGWNGGLNGTSNPIDVVLDRDKNVTATFVREEA